MYFSLSANLKLKPCMEAISGIITHNQIIRRSVTPMQVGQGSVWPCKQHGRVAVLVPKLTFL